MGSLEFASKLSKLEVSLLVVIYILSILPVTCLIGLVLVYRQFVILIASALRPDLLQILSPVSTIHTVKDPRTSSKVPATIVSYFLGIEGRVELGDIQDAFQTRVLQCRGESGDLAYPELTQYLVQWMGYHFWKEEDDFQLRNHVRLWNGKKNFKEIVQESVRTPFDPRTSPWKMEVLYNFSPEGAPVSPNTFCVLSVDHALTDGNTVMKILFEDFAASKVNYVGGIRQFEVEGPKSISLDPTTIFKSLMTYFDLVCGLYILSKSKSTWKKLTPQVEPGLGKILPLNAFSKFREKRKCSFAAVNLFLCTSAIRKLLQNRIDNIPERIPCFYPVPIPGNPHPRKLINHQ